MGRRCLFGEVVPLATHGGQLVAAPLTHSGIGRLGLQEGLRPFPSRDALAGWLGDKGRLSAIAGVCGGVVHASNSRYAA